MEYGQFCPIAKASEIVGEKWTILIVRELLLGGSRFNELHRGLSLISPTLLSRRLQSPAEKSLIAELQKAHDRILRLLEEVRGYASPMKLSRGLHDISPLWQEAWKQLSPHRTGRAASYQANTQGIDLHCLVDPFPIEQVFRNIFENSLAACNDPVRIGIACADAELNGERALQVRIQDNGTGLNAEQRDRIFEPFFTTKTNGTGLGMAIAKRIVEAHEGRIGVCDQLGVGTTIEVLLPRGRT